MAASARRYSTLARVLAGCLPRPVSLRDRDRLRARASRLLDSLDVRLRVSAPSQLSADTGEGGPGTLIVANHISWLDIVALLAVEPATFLAKREVGDWPLIGRIAGHVGTQFLDRGGLRELPSTVRALADLLRSGHSAMVFPEGTTWCRLPGGVFRRAPFQAAIDAGAPVRPVTIDYFQTGVPSTIAAFLGDDPLLPSVHRVARAHDLELRLRLHSPLPPTGDRRALAARAQASVRSQPLGSTRSARSLKFCG